MSDHGEADGTDFTACPVYIDLSLTTGLKAIITVLLRSTITPQTVV